MGGEQTERKWRLRQELQRKKERGNGIKKNDEK